MFALTALALATTLGATFNDDFENGSTGRWNQSVVKNGNTVTASSAAAHRGLYGLRVADNYLAATPDSEGYLGKVLSPTTGDFYFRAWVRVTTSAPPGGHLIDFASVMGDSGNNSMCTVGVSYPGARVQMKSAGGSGGSTGTGTGLADSSWHLLEIAATGSGTSSGACVLWWDGVLQTSRTLLNWSPLAWQVNRFAVGENYSYPTRNFLGTLDFDDVRIDSTAHASTLTLTGPASPAQYGCSPMTVGLKDSETGAAAAAPYAFTASLSASGAGGFFYADSNCTQAVSGAAFASGASSKLVYFSPSASGASTLLARFTDFLDATLAVTATPSTGNPPDAGSGDAGLADAGSPGGAADAGSAVDAGTSVGLDAGGVVDAGTSVGLDAGGVVVDADGGGVGPGSGPVAPDGGEGTLLLHIDIPDGGSTLPGSLVSLRFEVCDNRAQREEPLWLVLESEGFLLGSSLVSSAGNSQGAGRFALPTMAAGIPVSFTLEARVKALGPEASVRAWLQTESGEPLTAPAEKNVEVGSALLYSGCGCSAVSLGSLLPLALVVVVVAAGKRRARR